MICKYLICLIFALVVLMLMYETSILKTAFVNGLSSSDDTQIKTIIKQELKSIFNNDNVGSNTPIDGEIQDQSFDWINMTAREFTSQGERSTDILSVDYSNNGKFLNATLWM